jgi:hypothetical protein
MNWRAQAEHGGFHQAVVNGGIDCELRRGGPK